MRKLVFALMMVAYLSVTVPAQAQLRNEVPVREAPVRIYSEGSSFSLNKLFSPEHFQLRHSYELSYGSFGGQGLSLGTYTSSLIWQFSDKLAARADIAFSHTPFGTGGTPQALGGQNNFGKIYLRNAEIAYRPTENMTIHLAMRQSPYGRYASPYGYNRPYGGYGYGSSSSFSAGFGNTDRLFWNPNLR